MTFDRASENFLLNKSQLVMLEDFPGITRVNSIFALQKTAIISFVYTCRALFMNFCTFVNSSV